MIKILDVWEEQRLQEHLNKVCAESLNNAEAGRENVYTLHRDKLAVVTMSVKEVIHKAQTVFQISL